MRRLTRDGSIRPAGAPRVLSGIGHPNGTRGDRGASVPGPLVGVSFAVSTSAGSADRVLLAIPSLSMSHSQTDSKSKLNQLAFTQGLDSRSTRSNRRDRQSTTWDAGVTVFREGDQRFGSVRCRGRPCRDRDLGTRPGTHDHSHGGTGRGVRLVVSLSRTTQDRLGPRGRADHGLWLSMLADCGRFATPIPSSATFLRDRFSTLSPSRLKATRMQLLDIYGH